MISSLIHRVDRYILFNFQKFKIFLNILLFSSVQFSRSVVSDSLRPHESQHARPPCPSPTPAVYSNSCPSSWWCHPAISSSVVPFSSCPQPLPASESFPMSQPFAWGGKVLEFQLQHQFLPMNTQDWSPLGWTGWISLRSKEILLLQIFNSILLGSENILCKIAVMLSVLRNFMAQHKPCWVYWMYLKMCVFCSYSL